MRPWTRHVGRRAAVPCAALLALACAPAPAGAGVTIGQLASGGACSPGISFVQHSVAGPPGYRVPAGGGVITRWALRQGAASGEVKLRVSRHVGGTTYRTLGDSVVRTLTPSADNTFGVGPPGIAVQEGDVIGLRTTAGSPHCHFNTAVTGDVMASTTTDPAPGLTANYFALDAGYRLNLTALVEPDRDGDSLGDESQDSDDDNDGLPDLSDNCPTTASGDTADADGDGQGNPCDQDDDGDGLSDAAEATLGTNPNAPDTDGDGRQDGLDGCPLVAAATANGCPDLSLDTAAPGVALAGFPSRIRRRNLLRRGLRGTITPSEQSSLEVRLLGTLSGARITRAGDVVLAETALPASADTRRVTLRVTRRARRRLARRLRLRLEVVATDVAGNRTRVTRRITVR